MNTKELIEDLKMFDAGTANLEVFFEQDEILVHLPIGFDLTTRQITFLKKRGWEEIFDENVVWVRSWSGGEKKEAEKKP